MGVKTYKKGNEIERAVYKKAEQKERKKYDYQHSKSAD